MKKLLMLFVALLILFVPSCASLVREPPDRAENDSGVTFLADEHFPRLALPPTHIVPVVLRVVSRAIPRWILPTDGQHLQMIAWSFTVHGGDIQMPSISFELTSLTGRVADERGVSRFRHFTLWDLDARRILAGPLEPHSPLDGHGTGRLIFAPSLMLRDQETVLLGITMDTDVSEAPEYASVDHLYRVTIGDGSFLLDPGSIRAVDGRVVSVVSNSPLVRDLHIMPVGHPVVQPLDADQDLISDADRIFLHWRLRSSGAPLTLKRFVTSYSFEDGRPGLVPLTLTFQHERDGNPLLGSEASIEPASSPLTDEQATSVRFMPEMFVGSDWVDFVVRGQVTSPVFSGARLTFSMSLAPFTETAGRLTSFERRASGLFGPHIWTSRYETCPVIGPDLLLAHGYVESGVFVWSPLTDGFHDDIPCGSPDWYGALFRDADRVRMTNTLIAP